MSGFQRERYEGWGAILADLMVLYLFVVLVRTLGLLAFSFLERFFTSRYGEPKDFPLVSVIVPCYNEERVIRAAIRSINQLDYPNLEILVIDDGSTDSTLLEARSMESRFRVRVIHQENSGKAQALNRGIMEAVGEYVLCVDADSMLDPQSIKKAIVHFEHRKNLAAVAGTVKVGNVHNHLTLFQHLEYMIGLNFHKRAQSFLGVVNIVPGPIGLFHRDTVLQIGGYHSDTFAEDCDLTVRLLTAGYEVVYEPEMVAITEAPDVWEQLIKQRYRWSRGIMQALIKNAVWLFRPHRSLRNFFAIWYMAAESLLIPLINFAFVALSLEYALLYGSAHMFGSFFLGLTLLDMVVVFYNVSQERQSILLVLVAAVNRVTYGLALEVLRFFSLIDQLFQIPMGWGKLVRKGLR